jgi:hypothetical protein
MFSLSNRQLLTRESEFEKKFQKAKPINTNKEYGIFSDGILAKLPKNIVKTKVETKG